MNGARFGLLVLFVVAAFLPAPRAAGADGPDAKRRYKLERREMELLISSRTDAILHVNDSLVAQGDGTGVAKLAYVLPRVGPLIRLVVHAPSGAWGTGTAATPEAVTRALDAFVRRKAGQDVSQLPGPYMLGDRGSPVQYPSGVAVVAREADGDIAVGVMGDKPIIEVSYDIGVMGRAMTERSLPDSRRPPIRSFTRFEIPQLAASDGSSSRLKFDIQPKVKWTGPRRSVMVDPRTYWRAEVTQIGGPTQAVDLTPNDDADRLSATLSNSHILVGEGGSSRQQRVQTTQLSFVLPPPTIDDIAVVGAIVDVAPDRAAVVERALRALDAPRASAVIPIVLGASPDDVLRQVPASLVVPATRAAPGALLQRARAASDNERAMLVFTDRPLEMARAAAAAPFSRHLHIIHVAHPSPRGWWRVLGLQNPEAAAIERRGGIWIELVDTGLALDSLWEHLIWPRFLDDIRLTLNGAPFQPGPYLSTAFEAPGQPPRPTPPGLAPLGTGFWAMLVSTGPSPGTSTVERWEISGLAWNKRLRFSATATVGYLAIRNLRVSAALKSLPAPYRTAVEAYLSELGDVRSGVHTAYVVP